MALVQDTSVFVAGHYKISWNGVDMGTTEKGISFTPMFHFDPIHVDDLGDALVDGIFQGYNIRITSELSQWGVANVSNEDVMRKLQFPFDTMTLPSAGSPGTPVTGMGSIVSIGQTMKMFVRQLVLDPGNATVAVNTHLLKYRFDYAAPDREHGGWVFNSRLRKVTMNMIAFANLSDALEFVEGTSS